MTDTPVPHAPCAAGMARMPLHGGVTYGPVRSRRLGASLGVNVLPAGHKVCSFNCTYCQYGWTETAALLSPAIFEWPDASAVAASVATRLEELRDTGAPLDRITLAGHGEPTLHPDLGGVVDALRGVRDRLAPGVALAILSNSSTAGRPEVRTALARLDERYMKLDAGDQDTLRHVNATALRIEEIVEWLSAIPDIVLQAMFVRDERGRIDNASPAAVAAWLRAVGAVRPHAAHLYTLARQPAWAGLHAVPRDRLLAIARDVRALGVPAFVFD